MNDPTGTAIKLEEYFLQFSHDFGSFFKLLIPYSLYLSIFICSLEIVLGFALLTGWQSKLISRLLLITILFFSLLTGYTWLSGYQANIMLLLFGILLVVLILWIGKYYQSEDRKRVFLVSTFLIIVFAIPIFLLQKGIQWQFNPHQMKVTDCGCFGEFLHLPPSVSFWKDIVLLFFILVVYFGYAVIKPWFSKHFAWNFILFTAMGAVGFGVYNYLFLPVWDFLPYQEGVNLKKATTYDASSGLPEHDIVQHTWIMQKSSDTRETNQLEEYDQLLKAGYILKEKKEIILQEGYKPAIDYFSFAKGNINYADTFLDSTKNSLLIIKPTLAPDFNHFYNKMNQIHDWAKANGATIYGLYSKQVMSVEEYTKLLKYPITWIACDEKQLRSMSRYNTTLYYIGKGYIKGKWSSRWLPSINKLEKLQNEKN